MSGDETNGLLRTAEHGGEGAPWEAVRRFRVVVIDGDEIGARAESNADRCCLGSAESNDLQINDAAVSRFHCEIKVGPHAARIIDLGSRNGTFVDGVRVRDADLREGSSIKIGRVTVRFEYELTSNRLPLAAGERMGDMVGSSVAMRSVFAMLQRAASSEVTVLIEGETGTGKTLSAYELHRAGPRPDSPFVTIDCGAVPANLLESELFGHERGAFTGADSRRVGAFEEAARGTVFIDEIGELPLPLQTKLLRVLEARQFRRVGSNETLSVDARIVFASNRDLREEVNAGRFRADLYFRLAVVCIRQPPLRERADDIPALVDQILSSLGANATEAAQIRSPQAISTFQNSAWPGNVRELRNHIQRCLFFGRPLPPGESIDRKHGEIEIDTNVEFAEAKRRVVGRFERTYVARLIAANGGSVARAAQAAGMHRVSFHRLVRAHDLQHLTTRGRK